MFLTTSSPLPPITKLKSARSKQLNKTSKSDINLSRNGINDKNTRNS